MPVRTLGATTEEKLKACDSALVNCAASLDLKSEIISTQEQQIEDLNKQLAKHDVESSGNTMLFFVLGVAIGGFGALLLTH